MEWIDVRGLQEWSQRLDARSLLMRMLVDLIKSTAGEPTLLRFPYGDAAQLRGWDGDLCSKVAIGRVPEGESKWEFGTGAAEAKATSDYKKRTDQTAPEVMKANTLVLVNLTSWDAPKKKITDWVKERNEEKRWKAVRFIDGVELVDWLNDHPAIAARYAREVLLKAPKDGALSVEEYWDEFRNQFDPPLHEKLVIAGRQTEADALISQLTGPAKSILLGAETSEEVIAFAVAAIRSAPQSTRERLEARTLIVRNESAARFLSHRSNMCFLAIGEAERLAGVLANNSPTLSVVTGPKSREVATLNRPNASDMAEGFKEMGIEHRDGYELAHRCGRSLTILKRLIFRVPPKDPDWLPMVETLKPAFMAGGWSRDLVKDREILAGLAALADYRELEKELVKTSDMPDRPVDREEEIWQVRAPVDAFYFYENRLDDDDFDRLRDAVLKVFGQEPERPTRDQKFNLAGAASSDYSSWLRDGLALTLLVMATAQSGDRRRVRGMTLQQYADELVQALPGWGKEHASISRLGDQTAVIAEASPIPFLGALESILEGETAASLQDLAALPADPFNSGTYAYTEILWALETLAWDPRHLMRAALLLAHLAALDPDFNSNHVTRPINSLREIFVAWSPSTYATQAKRIATIDAIIAAHPAVGWELILRLLPRHHDSSSSTRKPKIRDLLPENPEEITFGLVWDFQSAIVSRALDSARGDEGKLTVLVGTLGQLQPNDQEMVIEEFGQYLQANQTELGVPLWHALRDELARNVYFASAEWTMRDASLHSLQDLVDRYRPTNPLATDRQVFDDWTPHVGNFDRDAGIDPEAIRVDALRRVLDRDGVDGVLALSKMVKLPGLLAGAVSGLKMPMEDLLRLLEKANADPESPKELVVGVSGAGARAYGKQWIDAFSTRFPDFSNDGEVGLDLLLGWPGVRSTWDFVDSLGPHAQKLYWRNVTFPLFEGTREDLMFAVLQFQAAKRDIDVLPALMRRGGEFPTQLIYELLLNSREQLSENANRNGTMLAFYLEKALAELRQRDDAEAMQVASLEYAYFPLIHRESNDLLLFSLLATEPSLYVDLLTKLYRRKDTPADVEISEEQRNEARAAFKVIHEFKRLPGLKDGHVVEEALLNWVLQVRALAERAGIGDIADQRVGALLAYAPIEQSQAAWPPAEVCRVIESVASSQLETGFEIECFNKRGVHVRSINEGGGQERQLADQYDRWSDMAEKYPRVSSVLASVADSWRSHARRQDVEAEQGKMKM